MRCNNKKATTHRGAQKNTIKYNKVKKMHRCIRHVWTSWQGRSEIYYWPEKEISELSRYRTYKDDESMSLSERSEADCDGLE
jgi:hypothetical protein